MNKTLTRSGIESKEKYCQKLIAKVSRWIPKWCFKNVTPQTYFENYIYPKQTLIHHNFILCKAQLCGVLLREIKVNNCEALIFELVYHSAQFWGRLHYLPHKAAEVYHTRCIVLFGLIITSEAIVF